MTTFEIIMTVAIVAIVVLLIVLVALVHEGFKNTWTNQNCMYDLVNNADEYNTRLMQNIFDQLQDTKLEVICIRDQIIEHKSDERNDNMFPFMQEIMRNYNPPCYAPDGICTNPCGDCINCPKRGTGGSWSTSTNKITEE